MRVSVCVRWLVSLALASGFHLGTCRQVGAQPFPAFPRVELSDNVDFDKADNVARSHLNRVRDYIDNAQWDDAIETLRQLMASHGDTLVEAPDYRLENPQLNTFINVRTYCQLMFASLPPQALELYRRRVDPEAQRLYQQGMASGDQGPLLAVVEQFFCSSYGDDALLALGDMAMEQGDAAAARDYWFRILPSVREACDEIPPAVFEKVRKAPQLAEADARLLDESYKSSTDKFPAYRLTSPLDTAPETAQALLRFWRAHGFVSVLSYPDPQLDLAAVEARLVLSSILEGSLERAQSELSVFARLYPKAQGYLAGRQVVFTEMLAALLQAASNWSAAEGNSAWQTFAGNAVRNPKLSGEIDLRGGPIWTADLRKVTLPDPMVAVNYGYRQRRVAEDSQNGLLSYFPVFWRDAVLYCNEDQVFAVNLSDGRPVWPAAASRPAERQAEIFRNERPGPGMSYQSYLGAPRFTLTVVGNKLLARLGPGLTSSVNQVNRRPIGSCLVCLDLAAQGRVVWDIEPEGDEWAFEGTPISDGQFVYAALRRGGVRSRAHVVCYDLETGRQRWRQFVCSSDTPGKDQVDECSHHLLTLHQGVVYYNTNLGAFAALAARDGKLQWLATYDRGSPADEFHVGRKVAHLYRDLTPCVYDNGLVMFAPADSSQIFIVDAAGGRFVGATAKSVSGDSTEGAVHLLGVVDDTLIATGDKVWWISIEKRGRLLLDPFPQGHLPAGYGRGLLADGRIYWPTRDEIYVLDQRTGQMARPPIQLKQRGATGGNLFLQKNRLLIAGPDKLYAFELSDMSTRLTPMENTPAAAAVPRN